MTPVKRTFAVVGDFPRHMRVGDYIESPRRKYVVVTSRKMNTRDGRKRFALGLVHVDTFPEGAFIWTQAKGDPTP